MKNKITDVLISTEREGIHKLCNYLDKGGFFISPASVKYHDNHKGGLAEHSWKLFKLLVKYNKALELNCPHPSIIISSLLHDVCKMGSYIKLKKGGYTYDKSHPKGHAELSLKRITRYIKLTKVEELMIKYHMGVFGLKEFDEKKGEYPLRNKGLINAWYHYPIVKVMYFCDEIVSLQSKPEEIKQ